jgi:hypothetical protein
MILIAPLNAQQGREGPELGLEAGVGREDFERPQRAVGSWDCCGPCVSLCPRVVSCKLGLTLAAPEP